MPRRRAPWLKTGNLSAPAPSGQAGSDVVAEESDAALRRSLADLDSLPIQSSLLELLHDVDAQWQQLRERIAQCDHRIQSHAKADVVARTQHQLRGTFDG